MIGLVLLTLGALNAPLALTVETCTQGSADSLGGGFLTLLLYLAGTLAFIASPPGRWVLVPLLPAAAIAAWHSVFALRFSWGYWNHQMSACHAINGGFTLDQAGEWMDGREPMFTVLWCGVSLLFWVAALLGSRRMGRPKQMI